MITLKLFYVSRSFLGKSKRHIFQYLLTFYLSRSNFFLNVLDLWDKESIKNSLVCLLSGKKLYVRQSFWPIHTTFSMQVFFSDGYLIMHSFFRFFFTIFKFWIFMFFTILKLLTASYQILHESFFGGGYLIQHLIFHFFLFLHCLSYLPIHTKLCMQVSFGDGYVITHSVFRFF